MYLCMYIYPYNTYVGAYYSRASTVVGSLQILFPAQLKVIKHAFEDRTAYRQWLMGDDDDVDDAGFRDHVTDPRAAQHVSSPFVWFGADSSIPEVTDVTKFIGGHDDTLHWARSFAAPPPPVSPASSSTPASTTTTPPASLMVDDGHVKEHTYDYDLIVIGGGSGGMAAAKEAAAHGATVACLDYVKPSPAGTAWGLGGTCVNVGCIPKKLMHAGALLHESLQHDLASFGIEAAEDADAASRPKTTLASVVIWDKVRQNVQNYIRSLNFKYRVALREKKVEYINSLAKFVDPHTITATNKKGDRTTLTASRFLIAVGGRPAPLACEGGDLAISSDDVFALEQNPGKTLCVGASYISLECAGFLAGYGNDVTVAVRSILLRGFDRDCVERIGAYMKGQSGIHFKNEVTPTKLEKVDESGRERIRVTFSDGTSETYDTVLAAVGRYADTEKLGLEALQVKTNPKNGKISTKHEQSISVPNIYAVGDVMDGCPELTPVAIQAGQLLARRLFGGSSIPMDYVNICTAVFTPIEYACLGLSEEDAIAQYGETNIEVYVREFMPLEWSLSSERAEHNAFTKVLVDTRTKTNQPVLGIHYVGPNAGEVMQGYGAAIKNGLTYDTLKDTVGIHPTSSEEIVQIAITKRSGVDASAGGC